MHIVLASRSPRRKEILSEIVSEFSVVPARGEERVDLSLSPERIVTALAIQKAREVFSEHSDCAVIGADTIVYFAGKVLGKPKDILEARRTLKLLSGNTHEVYTGVCVMTDGSEQNFACRSFVTFRNLSEEEIEDYIASGSPMDKAGAYGVQDRNTPVCKVEGSITNVVGLPKEELREKLFSMGIIK